MYILAAVLLAILVVVSFWASFGLTVFTWLHPTAGSEFGAAGQWGDTFGALNALFGGFAFFGVIATLRMQQRQQHLELFDGTFFQLLMLLRELRSEVKIRNRQGVQQEGHVAFEYIYDLNLGYMSVTVLHARTQEAIASAYSDSTRVDKDNPLGPFFRIIYSILRRISEDSKLSRKEKDRYGNLVRSHLSTAEVGLIGLNGLTVESNNFAEYIIEFRLLKYLPDNPLKTELARFYPESTFRSRD